MRSALRLIAVGLAGVLVVCGLTVPAQADPGRATATSSSCGLPESLAASGGARTVQATAPSTTAAASSFEADCGDAATTRFTALQAAADDVVISMRVDDLDPQRTQKYIDEEVEQHATLSDFVQANLKKHGEYLPETTGEWIDFDGRLQVDGDVIHLIIPGPEATVEWAWWYSLLTGAVLVLTTVAVTTLCIAVATVVAPPFVVACSSVGGFVGGFASSLLSSKLNNGQLDLRALNDAFWAGLCNTVVAAAGESKVYPWAKDVLGPVLKKAGQAVARAGRTALKWAGEKGVASAQFVREMFERFRASAGEKLLEWARDHGLEVAATDLRVMPLGDSITHGIGSSTESSYRADLWNQLTGDRHTVDFVGSARSGQLPDPDHEGHSGKLISEIAAQAKNTVPLYRPNVVALHAGTNDMDRNHQVSTAPDRLGALIDQVLADSPGVTVLVSTLVPTTNTAGQARISAFNEQVHDLVHQRQMQGRKVRTVTMNEVTTADLRDGLHPNDNGYRKMATAFRRGVSEAVVAGSVKTPGAVECSDAPNRWVERGRIAKGTGASSANIVFADLDGDGRDDYLVLDRRTGTVDAWLNRGGDNAGTAGWEPRGRVATGTGHSSYERVEFADIDGDGRDDYLVVDSDGSVRAWINKGGDRPGAAGWVERGQIAEGVGGDGWPVFVDIDGDGRDDYVKINSETGAVNAWLNRGGDRNGQPGWEARGQIAKGGLHGVKDAVRFANVDCDPRSDYLVLKPGGAVNAWLNRGGDRGGTAGWLERGQIAAGIRGLNGGVFADMDGDGRDDYLLIDSGGSVDAWLNRGGDPA